MRKLGHLRIQIRTLRVKYGQYPIEDYVKRQKKRLSGVPPHIVTGAKPPKTILGGEDGD
jgi:hypothetical protein